MIDKDTYLTFCDEALEDMTRIVVGLGDDLANRRPGLPGANSAYAILTHCLGVMGHWASTVNLGIVVPRDRPAEFTASGRVDELAGRVAAATAKLHADVAASEPAAAPVNPSTGSRRDAFESTQGGVLMHVYEELAQHRGQLEITRDLLRASPPGGSARP